MEALSHARVFEGTQTTYEHASDSCSCRMRFSVFVPPGEGPFPALYWLSGLTCTEENFTAKAGAQRVAAELGIVLIAPDTSPRGVDLPGEDDDWDFGSGAGFYVNATQSPWARHYRMDEYVTRELPELVESEIPVVPGLCSVSGHSMGGHGALVLSLRNPELYRSVSAFAPICAPTQVPWGRKAFRGYLGDDEEEWKAYDACELLAHSAPVELLVDQGDADPFLEEQLQPELLEEAAREHGHTLDLRMRSGYDHSYFYIATFIEEHLRWHAERLKKSVTS